MIRPALGILLCVIGGCFAACSSTPRAQRLDAPTTGPCPFEPTAILIHPLTRIVTQPDQEPRIDAHIEMRDAAGDEVKGAGRLVIELFRGSGPFMGSGVRQQIVSWETDLADAEENSRAFDRVTRTYRFELQGVPEAALEGGIRLRASLRLTDGRELSDEATISR